jgi:hypothetical protein
MTLPLLLSLVLTVGSSLPVGVRGQSNETVPQPQCPGEPEQNRIRDLVIASSDVDQDKLDEWEQILARDIVEVIIGLFAVFESEQKLIA